MFAQFCWVAVFAMSEGLFVVAVSGFEGVFCDSHVCFISVCGSDGSLVNDVSFKALVLEWAQFLCAAVAFFLFFFLGGVCFVCLFSVYALCFLLFFFLGGACFVCLFVCSLCDPWSFFLGGACSVCSLVCALRFLWRMSVFLGCVCHVWVSPVHALCFLFVG